MDETKVIYGTGCTPSVIDGTEHEITIDEKIELPNVFTWRGVMPPVRDLGATQECVCYSLTSVLDFYTNSENGVSNVFNGYNVDELYSIRANKNLEGMTIKEALHYLRHHGLNNKTINAYAKITSVMTAKYALINFGPIVAGLPVYQCNSTFWNQWNNSKFQGGHCITIIGYDDEKQQFTIRNSWGTSWGDSGHTYISYNDFVKCCFEAWTVTL